jgi:hypothetical protein
MVILFATISLAFLIGSIVAYRRQSSFRWLLVFGTAIATILFGLLAILAFSIAYSRPELGTELNSVEWLDSRATDISFYRANDFSGALAYEFSIRDEDFTALAHEQNWHTVPTIGQRNVMRYMFFLPEKDARRTSQLFAEVENGLFFESRRPNGCGITVLYDTNASRAYVFQSSR